MSADETPARRGAGRPRKAQPEAEAKPTSDPGDPRIGQSCDRDWSSVGYGDGGTYRCENGVIVERIG